MDNLVMTIAATACETRIVALGLCEDLGVAHCTLHYVVHPLLQDEQRRRGRRLAGPGEFPREHRLRGSVGQ